MRKLRGVHQYDGKQDQDGKGLSEEEGEAVAFDQSVGNSWEAGNNGDAEALAAQDPAKIEHCKGDSPLAIYMLRSIQ